MTVKALPGGGEFGDGDMQAGVDILDQSGREPFGAGAEPEQPAQTLQQTSVGRVVGGPSGRSWLRGGVGGGAVRDSL